MKSIKEKAIRLNLESYLYLQNEGHRQRIGNDYSDAAIERLKKNYYRYKNGIVIGNGWLGGAIGNPENSYEEGRWIDWSVEDMKKMLDEKGLKYEEDIIESIIL